MEYVIDFYQGRGESEQGGARKGVGERRGREGEGGERVGMGSASASATATGTLNFYLDVRPKLNSWEGWKTRVMGLGIWGGDASKGAERRDDAKRRLVRRDREK